ncbi:GntR family transcriptional regulator [Prauserella oleivorans]|uniref:GntR family transcriptional regulator n=1 Tax=Prauserella oleivorans TaxID=1478153 RepID=A0ABW5W4J9_9PSEU
MPSKSTPDALSPPTPSARDRAYDWIANAILSGTYSEGEFLDEVGLAREVGTSRTPIREALHRLRAERFVELVPRKGAQVRVVTVTEMREIYQARYVIEADALTKICARRLGAPAESHELVAAMEAARRDEDWNSIAQLDQRFHAGLVRHAGNAVMADIYESLRPRQIRLAVKNLHSSPERLPVIEREHRELVAAIDEHDRDRSVEILGVHLREVPELIRAFSR